MSGRAKCALCGAAWVDEVPRSCRVIAEQCENVAQLQIFASLVRSGLTAEQAQHVMRATMVEA